MAVAYLLSLFFLLRFFVVWLCLGALWPRVRCGLPLYSSSFLFVNLLCACLLSAGSGLLVPSCFFLCLLFHSALHVVARPFLSFTFFFSLRSWVLAALDLDGRLEPQALAGGEVRAQSHLLVLTTNQTKPNQAKPSQAKTYIYIHIIYIYTHNIYIYVIPRRAASQIGMGTTFPGLVGGMRGILPGGPWRRGAGGGFT